MTMSETVQRIDAPRTKMTVGQARKALVESLQHLKYTKSVREVKTSRSKVTWVGDFGGVLNYSLAYAEANNLSVGTSGQFSYSLTYVNGKWGPEAGAASQFFVTEADALKFIDAILTLKAAAQGLGSEEADIAAFSEKASVWRLTSQRPEMADEVRTYKLLAEEAFKRQDFAAALEAYCDALDLYPMWPEGHYNAALLAAETKDYGLAAGHMHRYLILAPDAKDAATAKDKLLLWQHKAKG
jgi:tetratricopeptide (TPR) repeat protein